MNLKLYLNSAERNRIDKTNYLTLLESMEGTLRNSTSITNPEILIERASGVTLINIVDDDNNDIVFLNDDNIYEDVGYTQDLLDCNYMYIPEFKRYYFIDDITSVSLNMWLISAHVDVLMSYNSIILEHYAFVTRNQYTYNDLIRDDAVSFYYDKDVTEYEPSDGALVNTTFDSDISRNTNAPNYVVSTITNNYAGTNTINSSPDTNVLPNVSNTASGSGVSYLSFALRRTDAVNLSHELVDDDNSNKVSFILSIMAFPFQVTTSGGIYSGLPVKDGVISGVFCYYMNQNSDFLTIADFTITGSTFLDYEPYTQYELYIPYCGWVSFNSNNILNNRIVVTYSVDYATGQAQVMVIDKTNHKLLYTSTCQLGVRLPVNSTNAYDVSNNKLLNNISLALGLSSSALSMGLGYATDNPLAIAGGILSTGKTISTFIGNNNANYEKASGSVSSGYSGLYLPQKVRVRKTILKPKNYDSNYASLLGKPLNQYVKLSSLSGLTVVGAIHLENLSSATSNEYTEIETLLKQGIII